MNLKKTYAAWLSIALLLILIHVFAPHQCQFWFWLPDIWRSACSMSRLTI